MPPDDLLLAVLAATLGAAACRHLNRDVCVGNVQMSARVRGSGADGGAPRGARRPRSPLYAVNRQCSSGLQAVATTSPPAIWSAAIDAGIGAGVESMSHGGGVANPQEMPPANWDEIQENPLARDCLVPMGITAENVAERYGISRADQELMAVESHEKALAAQASGRFDDEIVPLAVGGGNSVRADEGPRPGTTLEKLAKLRPAFKPDGVVTAGTSSQVSDGAAAVLPSSAAQGGRARAAPARRAALVPRRRRAAGRDGRRPGGGDPRRARRCGAGIGDVDVFEINEAFARAGGACVRKLGIPAHKVNPLGGAIALGHPLGCTGARQVATLLHELRRRRARYGVVSMCIGTGMGAAAVFEAE